MEKEPGKILEFRKTEKSEDEQSGNGEKPRAGGVVEADFERETRIKEFEKELEEIKKEFKNFEAKIILGEDTPGEKAALRRDFMLRLDGLGKKVSEMSSSIIAGSFYLTGPVEERQGLMMRKILKIEKGLSRVKEDVWDMFKKKN